MKKFRILTLSVCFILLLTSSASAIPTLSGETESKRTTTTLYNGVVQTHIETPSSSAYKSQKINIVEFDLAQRDLYFDVVYGKGNAYGLMTTKTATENFTKADNGKTAIAAVNGDLWMVTYAHARVEGSGTTYGGLSNAVVKRSLNISRGFNISDGEIYTTAHMTQETPYEGDFWSFGVTDDFVPVLGNPYANVKITDVTNGKSTTANGINRLPANNALVMYTDKVMGSVNEFALDDAYEIVIDFTEDYKISHGTSITGKVSAIYDSTKSQNPGLISDKQIVLTARGNKVSGINGFAIGDSVKIEVSIGDKEGNDEAWQRVQNAVGGHIQFVVNGVLTQMGPGAGYPATLVGYTKDKKILFITVDGRGADGSTGVNPGILAQLAKDTGLYNAFILDGGGSTTMVVTADGTNYKVVNTPSDKWDNDTFGCPRTVNNSIIVSHGPQRAAQGEFEILLPEELDIDPENLSFPTKAYVDAVITGKNECISSFAEGTLKLTASGLAQNDAYCTVSYASMSKSVSADNNKYITLVYRLPSSNALSSYSSQFFLCANGAGPAESSSKKVQVKKTDKYEYVVVDASKISAWKGTIDSIRLDFFVAAREGDSMFVKNIVLAKTKQEAEALGAELAAQANGVEITTAAPETTPPEPETAPATETVTEPATTAEPEATQPIGTQPIGTQPIGTQPIGTQPIGSQPIGSQPISSQPISSQPIDATDTTADPATTIQPEGTDTSSETESGESGGISPIIPIIIIIGAAVIAGVVAFILSAKKSGKK